MTDTTDTTTTDTTGTDGGERRVRTVPLPATTADYDAALVFKRKTTPIDEADMVLRAHWEDLELQRYLNATMDEEAITGLLDFDNLKAAELVQKWAQETGLALGNMKVAGIVKAMNFALGRHKLRREQRLGE